MSDKGRCVACRQKKEGEWRYGEKIAVWLCRSCHPHDYVPGDDYNRGDRL